MKHRFDKFSTAGFTMMEVLVTIVILGIGLAAVAGLQVLGTHGNIESEERTIAANIVQAKIQELNALSYRLNSQAGGAPVMDAALAPGTYTERVNEAGLTAEDIETRYSASSPEYESFKYTLSWRIQDMGDQGLPGGWKQVSITISWLDLEAANSSAERASIQFNNIPITMRYL